MFHLCIPFISLFILAQRIGYHGGNCYNMLRIRRIGHDDDKTSICGGILCSHLKFMVLEEILLRARLGWFGLSG
jgi:hypothetical protein